MANVFSSLFRKLVGEEKDYSSHDPRSLVSFSDAYVVEHFARLGYSVSFEDLIFTIESVADFLDARENSWHKPGTIVAIHDPGLLVVENAQPRPGQRTRDVAVVSLGNARVVMGVINRTNRIPARYATSM